MIMVGGRRAIEIAACVRSIALPDFLATLEKTSEATFDHHLGLWPNLGVAIKSSSQY